MPADRSEWVPAFPGQRPPIDPMAPLKHGAYSQRHVDPVAQGFADAVLADEDVLWLRLPSYLPAIWAWARAEARVQLLTAWLADKPPIEGKLQPVLEQLRQWEGTAERARARLGLDPTSRAKLMKDLAVTGAISGGLTASLGSILERGRSARLDSEQRRALEVVPDDEGGDDDVA